MRSNYGRHYSQIHMTDEAIQNLSDVVYLENNKHRSAVELASELGVTYYSVIYAYEKYSIERTFDGYNKSLAEKEIADFVRGMGVDLQCGNRTLLGGKELDMYAPDRGIAIEFNGVYWHSEKNGKGKNYHLDKQKKCSDIGIRLVHILDTEWKSKEDIVRSRLSNLFGMSKRVYARKCRVGVVDNSTASVFFDRTHIQGRCAQSVAYGLWYEGTLVACMSFGKSRFSKKYEWELLRFSNELNTSVVGAAGKLFSYFKKLVNPKSVVSYCDLRWNTGNMYSAIGFTEVGRSSPNYWYTNNYTFLESRMRYQKHKLSNILPLFDESKSEWQNMSDNGFDRIWDCGNSVYVWNV